MFDGRNCKSEFEQACVELSNTKDPASVRRTLISMEWVLEEALRGVFLTSAFLLSATIFYPFHYILDIGELSWQMQILFFAGFFIFVAYVYLISRLVFWLEINRHLKPRKFGGIKFELEN